MIEKTIGFWRRLVSTTVWSESYMLEHSPMPHRDLYTVVFPLYYGTFFLFGIAGALAVVPAVEEFTTTDFADIWPIVIGGLAFSSLVGLIWRGHWLEAVSAILLSVAIAVYPVALFGLWITEHDINRAALGVALCAFIYLPGWRGIRDIPRIVRQQRAQKLAASVARALSEEE